MICDSVQRRLSLKMLTRDGQPGQVAGLEYLERMDQHGLHGDNGERRCCAAGSWSISAAVQHDDKPSSSGSGLRANMRNTMAMHMSLEPSQVAL